MANLQLCQVFQPKDMTRWREDRSADQKIASLRIPTERFSKDGRF
jgi:hypothetical protein